MQFGSPERFRVRTYRRGAPDKHSLVLPDLSKAARLANPNRILLSAFAIIIPALMIGDPGIGGLCGQDRVPEGRAPGQGTAETVFQWNEIRRGCCRTGELDDTDVVVDHRGGLVLQLRHESRNSYWYAKRKRVGF